MNSAARYNRFVCRLLLFVLLCTWTESASAQHESPTGAYLRTHVGLSGYWGDRQDPTGETSRISAPALSWEVGFPVNHSLTASAALQAGNYPRLDPRGTWHTWRFTGHFLLRYVLRPYRTVSPFGHIGAHITGGSQPEPPTSRAYGPSMGGGIRFALSRSLQLFAETTFHLAYPDDALDGLEGDRSYDLLSSINAGVQFSLSDPPVPFRLADVEGADTLKVQEEAVFSTSAENTAPAGVEYTWHFGDGTTGSGASVRHSYQQAGVYTVSVRGQSGDEERRRELTVVVEAANDEEAENPRFTTACARALKSADTAYRTRKFAAALDSLQMCLTRSGIAVEQRVRAYRLRTLIHLKQGEVEAAKNTLVQIFAIKPDYQADTVHDPPSYVSLVEIVKKQIGASSPDSGPAP